MTLKCVHKEYCTANYCPVDSGTESCGLKDFIDKIMEVPENCCIEWKSPHKGILMVDTDAFTQNTRLGQMVLAARTKKEETSHAPDIRERARPKVTRRSVTRITRHSRKVE